ncbi:MAG: hypothetical protein ACI4KD_09390 [Oscillospiraceae bacterium]
MIFIRVSINDEIKIIQFWCTQEDTSDKNTNALIDKIFEQIAPDKKYRKVIYRSGNKNLVDCTSLLLKQNRTLCLAKKKEEKSTPPT